MVLSIRVCGKNAVAAVLASIRTNGSTVGRCDGLITGTRFIKRIMEGLCDTLLCVIKPGYCLDAVGPVGRLTFGLLAEYGLTLVSHIG
jgi:hypothetical protein